VTARHGPDGQATDAESGTPRLTLGTDGVAVLTLRRPRHLNRLHGEDLLALQAHFERLRDAPEVRVLVLTGQGRAFCAGFHLGELGAADGPQAGATAGPQAFEHTVDALETLPMPTVARLNGSVYGGATDLALACDFRVGVQGMELRMPAARLGLHYYPSGLRRAVTRLGVAAAKRLFLLGETVDDRTLHAIGVLDALVPSAGLDAAVTAIVDALRAGAPLALRGMKASIDDIAGGRADPAVLRAREAACAGSADLREGLASFSERRPPRFRGH
jgi:enoyl-CoA hydratase/carnithine racemase